jgi:uncharacterized protein
MGGLFRTHRNVAAEVRDNPNAREADSTPFRVLSLDGGGAKGFYTLGVLFEIEALIQKPLWSCFDLIYGTSTGAIIAALLARGESVTSVQRLYKEHVPTIMRTNDARRRTRELQRLARQIFGDAKSDAFKTMVGIVTTNWLDEDPMIFKSSVSQAHGSRGSFVPFYGCEISDVIVASCSAYPFFDPHTLTTSKGTVQLADGGFCANNPSLYAIADAHLPLANSRENIRLVSLGVGSYPQPPFFKRAGRAIRDWSIVKHIPSSDFIQKILDTNTSSMETLYKILFKDVPAIRINQKYTEPELATDLMEHDLAKLERLTQKGRRSFGAHEEKLRSFLLSTSG